MEDGKNIWRQAEMKKKSVCSLATSGNKTREKNKSVRSLATSGNKTREKKKRCVVWRKAEIKHGRKKKSVLDLAPSGN
jgi:hypothetical protein